MTNALLCARCGASLAARAADVAVTCPFCGTTSTPEPKVIEKVVERMVVVNVEGEGGDPNAVGCPRCAKGMELVKGGGQEALACPKCAGGWVTHEQLAMFRKRRIDALAKAVASVRPVFGRLEPRQARLSCPVCSGTLRMEEVEGTVYLMHVCAEHGAFCESGALGAYNELHAEKRAGEIGDDELEEMGIRKKGFFGFFE